MDELYVINIAGLSGIEFLDFYNKHIRCIPTFELLDNFNKLHRSNDYLCRCKLNLIKIIESRINQYNSQRIKDLLIVRKYNYVIDYNLDRI